MAGSDPIARDPTVLAPGGGGGGARDDDGVDDRLAPGAVAGDYVVERHIGAGAMGDVYAGLHPVIGKRVAIKVLKRALASRADAAARFLREARAVNHVDHPGVVDVFALGRLDDGRLYLVMDLLDGVSLRERLRAGPIAPPVAMRVLREVASALDAAHGKGVVHRDLKPDNVVLTGPADAPTAHVLDFGIARLVADVAGERAPETLTGQGVWMGTPAYMAPEQWSADGATAASDRYALGIMAYELLSGRVPFSAPSLPAMMEQHFRATVPSIANQPARGGAEPGPGTLGGTASGADGVRAPLSTAVDRVLARALAKEPGARFPTSAALVTELEAALAAGPGRPAAGRAAWIAGLAAGAVMIAGVVVVVAGRDRRRPPARGPAASTLRPAAGAMITITSTPSGARVLEGGVDRGPTPLALPATPGREVVLELVRPGYVSARRVVTARAGDPLAVDAQLALVTGFEGVWALPDGGGLRAFERRGDQVAGFKLPAATAAREFLRFFEFAPATSGVVFAATEPFIDERAPEEPSCNIPLRAEYHYDPGADALALRRERAQYALVDGRCQLAATVWSEPRPLSRVAGAPADAVWAESRAGAGAPVNASIATDGKDGKDGTKGDAGLKPTAPSKPTKGPPVKRATEPPAKGGKGAAKVPPVKGAAGNAVPPPPTASLAPGQGEQDDDNFAPAMKKGGTVSGAKDERQEVPGPGIDRAGTPRVNPQAPVDLGSQQMPPPAPRQAPPATSQQVQSPAPAPARK